MAVHLNNSETDISPHLAIHDTNRKREREKMIKIIFFLAVFYCAYVSCGPTGCRNHASSEQKFNFQLGEILEIVRNYFGEDETSFRTISFNIENVVGNCDCASDKSRNLNRLLEYLRRFIKDDTIMRTITFNIINIVGNCKCPQNLSEEEWGQLSSA